MTVLDEIVAGVREDLAVREAATPLDLVKERAGRVPGAKECVSRLRDDEAVAVIAEVKRSSPSRGPLATITDPAALAAEYEKGGAHCISVLTEQRRFNGSLADLDAVRAAVDVPLLRKDFTLDEYQIWEARAHGADLILLIVAALSDAQLREFSALSAELGMNVLVETHTEEEIERATAANARIIGVNVRNLKTLDVDRSLFASLAGRIPAGALVVAESGVRDVDDVTHYAASGATAVLVGEALVSHSTPRERIAEFTAAGAAAIAARG